MRHSTEPSDFYLLLKLLIKNIGKNVSGKKVQNLWIMLNNLQQMQIILLKKKIQKTSELVI